MNLLGREIGRGLAPFFFAGPCVIESRDHALRCAEAIAEIAHRTGSLIVYKSSFDKANRTSGSSYRGPGLHEGLDILAAVKRYVGLPVITDVHEIDQIAAAASVADVLQTPALLARQTDFISAVAAAGKPVNIKKGQFMAPGDMEHVAAKARAAGRPGQPIMLCERGTSFGYNNLVVDMRSFEIMRQTGCPVVFDATHSVQLPGAGDGRSGGDRRFVPALARAAVAAGVDGVFMETHPDPDNALCDGPNALDLRNLEPLIRQLIEISSIADSVDFIQ